jgi:hypothetical protein
MCEIRSDQSELTKKEAKKKKRFGRGGLWKLPQPWKSARMLRDFQFMISTAAWKSLLAFPQLPQARRRLIYQPIFNGSDPP